MIADRRRAMYRCLLYLAADARTRHAREYPMSSNTDLIESFYQALQRRDGAAMTRCYHADAHFRDPVFDLRGAEVGAMWCMLTTRGKDLEVNYDNVRSDSDSGSANWQARYTFSASGRKVVNIISAHFQFRDGLFVEHQDTFDLWRWSRMALGISGLLLGWSPLLQNTVRQRGAAGLAQFIAAEKSTDQ
jgi:ketosteroid isomerase-like protein